MLGPSRDWVEEPGFMVSGMGPYFSVEVYHWSQDSPSVLSAPAPSAYRSQTPRTGIPECCRLSPALPERTERFVAWSSGLGATDRKSRSAPAQLLTSTSRDRHPGFFLSFVRSSLMFSASELRPTFNGAVKLWSAEIVSMYRPSIELGRPKRRFHDHVDRGRTQPSSQAVPPMPVALLSKHQLAPAKRAMLEHPTPVAPI